MPYDVVVVGGGPAGLSAGLMLGRYRRRTLIIDGGEQRNRWADEVHGYLGDDPTDPEALLGAARDDLTAYDDVEIRTGEVLDVDGRSGGFEVDTDRGQVIARRLVLATGVRDRFPDVGGFLDHYGTSVFHCPMCDGYEARDREVVVIGWAEHVAGFALDLLDWARSVTIVTNGPDFQVDPQQRERLEERGIAIVEQPAHRLVGTPDELGGIELADGGTLPCDLAFFSIDHEPVNGLAGSIGCGSDEEGYVLVDDEGNTSVDGVYAAGDITGGTQLVIVAAAEGATAGVASAISLRGT